MKLDAYLIETGQTASAFARKIGMAPSTLTRFRNGERGLGRRGMRLVIDGSGGKVTAEDLLFESGPAAGAMPLVGISSQDCRAVSSDGPAFSERVP